MNMLSEHILQAIQINSIINNNYCYNTFYTRIIVDINFIRHFYYDFLNLILSYIKKCA